jgi:hypothetical protein
MANKEGPVNPIGLPIVGEPGPEVMYLSDGTEIKPIKPTARDYQMLTDQLSMEERAWLFMGIPVKQSPFVPKGKAVLFDGENIKVYDLPEEAEKAEKE